MNQILADISRGVCNIVNRQQQSRVYMIMTWRDDESLAVTEHRTGGDTRLKRIVVEFTNNSGVTRSVR